MDANVLNPEEMEVDELKRKIRKLEEEKKSLIEDLKKSMKNLKYKKIEYQALVPLAKKAQELKIDTVLKKLRALEFKLSTQAISPKAEKKLIKQILELEKKLEKYRPMIIARKRISYVEKDIKELEEKIKEIESKLSEIRKNIGKLNSTLKNVIEGKKRGILYGQEEVELSLENIAVIEKE